ncbi:MAG: DNA primase DnaG [Halobacteriota archaeon]|nr:DNA primase DnaG [Halobacteriota archaeon]
MQNSDTTKYVIHANIGAEGVIERPDVVGAIFGQIEGLLGNELDLRDLQKTGRIGRIEVYIDSKGGRSNGTIQIPSSLDKTETAILGAALETIDRVGPCAANISVSNVEDVRASKRKHIIERSKQIITNMFDEGLETQEITEEVKQSIRVEEITFYGNEKLPAGPNINDSDAILIVEGRADVLQLLKYGIKNTVAVEGTNIPNSIAELSRKKTVTVFTDGDRGGELILKELLQVAEVDYVARAPDGKGVEELTQKEIVKALRNKVPVEQTIDIKDQKRKTPPKRRILSFGNPEEGEGEKERETKDNDNKFKIHTDQLSGTLNARLLDANDKVIKEVTVRDLTNSLRGANNVKSIVFDGVITQRILDISAEKGIECLIGAKMGNVVKMPTSIKVMTVGEL